MSTPSFSPDKEAALAQRMERLGVKESDLEESFVRSGGHGGQNVNKTATCVQLRHRPTGVQVKCQISRHQGVNRFLVRQILLDKLERSRRTQAAAARSALEKIRRQTRPRSRAAKQRMLADKGKRAEKKSNRRAVPLD